MRHGACGADHRADQVRQDPASASHWHLQLRHAPDYDSTSNVGIGLIRKRARGIADTEYLKMNITQLNTPDQPSLLLRKLPTISSVCRYRNAVTLDVTANRCYHAGMIVSFRDKRTREFAEGRYVKAFSGFSRQTEMKLDQLDAAIRVRDLAVLPGNRLETLKGDRKGQYSIRINDQWRLCFEWPSGSPGSVNVEIVDYH